MDRTTPLPASPSDADLTFSTKIGLIFQDELSISPAGVSWKGKRYPVESITRVRWGGVAHSINGIPTGTRCTVAFGDDRSEAVVPLDKKALDGCVRTLWRTVCVRLIVEMLDALKKGSSIAFENILVTDEAVTLAKRKFLGTQRVTLSWREVKVWSHNGQFCVGSLSDKGTRGASSYLKTPNTHLLEFVLRACFKKGITTRLSDLNTR